MSDAWVVRAASHPRASALTDEGCAHRSVKDDRLNDEAKKLLQEVARATASHWSSKLRERRGKQRCSALMNALTSRLAKNMRARRGVNAWVCSAHQRADQDNVSLGYL